MKHACAIGWRPAEFWAATPHELFTALDGWALAQGDKDALAEERRERFAGFRVALERAGVA